MLILNSRNKDRELTKHLYSNTIRENISLNTRKHQKTNAKKRKQQQQTTHLGLDDIEGLCLELVDAVVVLNGLGQGTLGQVRESLLVRLEPHSGGDLTGEQDQDQGEELGPRNGNLNTFFYRKRQFIRQRSLIFLNYHNYHYHHHYFIY